MVTIICKESGIEFEAASKRTQQHPRIAGLKEWGNKEKKYREVNEALLAVRNEGGYTTIDEYMVRVKAHLKAATDKATEVNNKRAADARQAAQEAEQRKRQRQAQNAKLRDHGYTWSKYARGTEDDVMGRGSYYGGVGEFDGWGWELSAPDGRVVSVEQALDEIARGADVVLAEIEAKRQAAAAKAAAEDEAKRQAEQLDAAARAEFDAEVQTMRDTMVEIEYVRGGEQIETLRSLSSTATSSYRRHDTIKRRSLDSAEFVVIVTGTAYDDDGRLSCWCFAPVPPQFTQVEPRPAKDDPLGLNATFRALFG